MPTSWSRSRSKCWSHAWDALTLQRTAEIGVCLPESLIFWMSEAWSFPRWRKRARRQRRGHDRKNRQNLAFHQVVVWLVVLYLVVAAPWHPPGRWPMTEKTGKTWHFIWWSYIWSSFILSWRLRVIIRAAGLWQKKLVKSGISSGGSMLWRIFASAGIRASVAFLFFFSIFKLLY